MNNRKMGDLIAELRKQKNMTQKDLAGVLNVTDKAVSKWERGLSCPDIATVPLLAQTLGITSEELLDIQRDAGHHADHPVPLKKLESMLPLILKAIALAMGVAVLINTIAGKYNSHASALMLSVGLVCISLVLLKEEHSREKP